MSFPALPVCIVTHSLNQLTYVRVWNWIEAEAAAMKITYFGHSCFLVEAQDHTRLILDPYLHGSFEGAMMYGPVDEPADVVLASHEHDDHSATDTISGGPRVFLHPIDERVGAVSITGIQTAHDDSGGSQRGKNTVTVLDDGDLRLVHLGDLGHLLDPETLKRIGPVDVLLVPVGGHFTIDHKEAAAVVDALEPGLVIPMHYKTPKVDFPIAAVDAFLGTQKSVQHNPSSTLEVTKATLPTERTIVVLPHAR
jgi:L-ascorbate metabolism protein UlaG (beta-lactamase superfamily)